MALLVHLQSPDGVSSPGFARTSTGVAGRFNLRKTAGRRDQGVGGGRFTCSIRVWARPVSTVSASDGTLAPGHRDPQRAERALSQLGYGQRHFGELGHVQVLAVEARWTRQGRFATGGAQREPGDVAAVRPPDLPVARDARAVSTVFASDACIQVEVCHAAQFATNCAPLPRILQRARIGEVFRGYEARNDPESEASIDDRSITGTTRCSGIRRASSTTCTAASAGNPGESSHSSWRPSAVRSR